MPFWLSRRCWGSKWVVVTGLGPRGGNLFTTRSCSRALFYFYFSRSAFAKNRLSTFKLQFIKFSLAMLFARALVVPLFITCSTAQSEKARAEPPRIIYELLLDLRKIPPPGRWIISAGKLRHNCFFVCLILSILAGWSIFCGKIYWNLNIECLIFFPTSWNW